MSAVILRFIKKLPTPETVRAQLDYHIVTQAKINEALWNYWLSLWGIK